MLKKDIVDAINRLMLSEEEYRYRKKLPDGRIEQNVFLPPWADMLPKRSLAGVHALAQLFGTKMYDLAPPDEIMARTKLDIIETVNALFPEADVPVLPPDREQRGVKFLRKLYFGWIYALAAEVCEIRNPCGELARLRTEGKKIPETLQDLFWLTADGQPRLSVPTAREDREAKLTRAEELVRGRFESDVKAFLRAEGFRLRNVQLQLV